MMHVGASTLFPAVYACDAFVDMSSYDWGNAEAQSGSDHEQHSVVGSDLPIVPREQRADDLRALRNTSL